MCMEMLVKLGFVLENDLMWGLSNILGIDWIFVKPEQIDDELVRSIPKEKLLEYMVIPIVKERDTIILAMAQPSDVKAKEEIEKITKCNVEVFLALPGSIQETIEKIFRESS